MDDCVTIALSSPDKDHEEAHCVYKLKKKKSATSCGFLVKNYKYSRLMSVFIFSLEV